MSEAEPKQMHAAVLALARDFSEIDGKWAVPDERLLQHWHRLQAHPPEERGDLIADLVVLAARLQRETAADTQTALAQLLALTTLLLGGAQAAQEAFEGAGVDVAGARKLIGSEGPRFDDSSEKVPGEAAASLLGMLKGNK